MITDQAFSLCGVAPIHSMANISDIDKKVLKRFVSFESAYITGPSGCGKTYLAAALARKDVEIEGGFTVPPVIVFTTVNKLLRRIKKTYEAGAREKESEIVDSLCLTKHLYLDDLGADKITDWSTTLLYAIIDERYSHGLPTIITSNYTLDELSEIISDRITSRIFGMCTVVELVGADRRIK